MLPKIYEIKDSRTDDLIIMAGLIFCLHEVSRNPFLNQFKYIN
jgi:hypothetical protein